MTGQRSKVLEHMRGLASNVVDARASESVRAGHARMLAEHAADTREALEIVSGVLRGSEVLDRLLVEGNSASPELVRAAADRIRMRDDLAQLRTEVVPIAKNVEIATPGTGRQDAAPLIRRYGVQVPNPGPRIPVVPGITTATAAVNPSLPLGSATQIHIDDVSDGARWDFAAGYVDVSKQALAWLDSTGAALLDDTLYDAIDVAAETDVVAAIEAAAGDTRVAATLADDLDGAEGAAGAGGLGAAAFAFVNPVDWPVVRRQLAAAWDAGPRPAVVVSPGSTAGTVTYAGPNAFVLLVGPRNVFRSTEPKLIGQDVSVMRQFKLLVRNADAIATVTGVGA